ncbi:MAG TPA: uracil-DNA glycosylase [Chloroflexota bacterium]|nr:uracil-DNA glycosylase [Chloroflexota bacterium]
MAEAGQEARVTCRACRHYHITWDPKAPHGCGALGFKSSQLPSLVVFQSSGLQCHAYAPKPTQTRTS